MAWLLFFALILDAVLGEPEWLWSRVSHPAVLMGNFISTCTKRLASTFAVLGWRNVRRGGFEASDVGLC